MIVQAKTKFFDEVNVVTNNFKDLVLDFGVRATGIIICVDTSGYVEYTFNGRDRHGKVYYGDAYVAFDNIDEQQMWLRSAAPVTVRVWAWLEQK